MKLFKNWHKSKTQWMNGFVVLVGLIEINTGEFRNLLGDYFGVFIIIIGMTGWYLRTITDTPMDQK